MTVGGGFRRLTRLLRRLERKGWTIDSVEPQTIDQLSNRESFEARVGIMWDGESDRSAAIESVESLRDRDDAIAVTPVFQQRNGSRHLYAALECEVLIEGSEERTTNESDQTEEPPLHRDVDRLQHLYDEYATFDEMAAAVETEVSAETIRRYTIEHGIHQPARSRRWSDPQPDDHEAIRGVPVDNSVHLHGHDIETIVEAVESANTLYDVQRALDLSRARTITLLRSLDLLDLVVGRLDRAADRSTHQETIRNRLRSGERGEHGAVAAGRNG